MSLPKSEQDTALILAYEFIDLLIAAVDPMLKQARAARLMGLASKAASSGGYRF